MPEEDPPKSSQQKIAETTARQFFRSGDDAASLKRDVRRWLAAVFWSAILIPTIFYIRFGEVDPIGWGLTVFFCVYCLLSAIGLHFLVKPEYHTPVALRGDWVDKMGAWWLVSCVFGPFLGYLMTAFTLNLENWRWLYEARVALCLVLPIFTALPLLRYVRGRGAPLMLAILLGVTALPVAMAWANLRDLKEGPQMTTVHAPNDSQTLIWQLVLPHTGQVLSEGTFR